REVLTRDDAARLGVERQMETEDIAFGEEGVSAFRDLVPGLSRPRQRFLSTPAKYPRAERPPHIRHQAANAAKGINADNFSLHANPNCRLPVPFPQTLHFIRDVA